MAAGLTVLASALFAPDALAQGVTGSAVTGVISDPSGGPVEGARIQLKNVSTGSTFDSVSGDKGIYNIDNIPPGGPFEMTISSEGYETRTESGIQLSLGQRLRLNVQLRFAGEMVEIVSHLDDLDDKARTGASTRVQSKLIQSLPLAGRNFTDLTALDPRASGSSIGGQNNRFNNIQIDGAANNDRFGLANNGTPGGQSGAKPLSIEAIREFVVQTSPFDVRLGQFAGGIVNAVTKSGTNEYQGSVWGYVQAKALSGRQNDPTYSTYDTEQFGASVSGPIIKDKAHFFIATDLQQRQSAALTGQAGNTFQLTGDDNRDRAVTGFTTADAQRFASILQNKYGITNVGTSSLPGLANPDRNLFVKVTSSAIDKSNLELSYNLVNASLDVLARNPFTNATNLRDGYQLSTAGYGQANTTHTLRGKLTTNWDGGLWSNELLSSFSAIRDARQMPQQLPLIIVKAGAVGASDSWLAAGGERFSQANSLDQNIFQLQDNVSRVIGNHRVTVGTSNEFFHFNNLFLQAQIGAWAFNSLDDFEAGNASAFQRRFAIPGSGQTAGTANFDVSQLGAYVQDEWTPFPNLTITPGIRIDVPYLTRNLTNPVLVGNTAFPIDTGKVPTGNPLFSPRVGVNWDVNGSSDTIVRGGVGVFTGPPPYVWVSNAYGNNGLASVGLSCVRKTDGTGVPTFTANPGAQPTDCAGGTGTPAAPTNQGEIDYFDPNTKYPQNLRFAAGVDRRLPFGIVLSADFQYTKDINGWYIQDANLVSQGKDGDGREVYGTFDATTFTGSTPKRPVTQRVDPTNLGSAVLINNRNGGHTYSATLQLTKQLGQIFTLSAGYTFSRSYDMISFTSSQAFSNFQFASVDGPLDNRQVRPSGFDRPHRVVIAGVANVGYGFAVGLNYVGQSGQPYAWTVNGDINGDGVSGNDLPKIPASINDISLVDPTGNKTPDQVYADLSKFIDSQSCLAAARGQILQRNSCRNPWQNFLDMRINWQSPSWKNGQHIEAQWDIFNVLNLISELPGHPFQDWSLFKLDAPNEEGPAFLKAVGYDTVNHRPIYTFAQPASVTNTQYSPTLSRWRMQLGAKYVF
jgi:hypothetical protein